MAKGSSLSYLEVLSQSFSSSEVDIVFRAKDSKLRNQPDFPRPTQGPEQFREVRSALIF